MEVPAEEVLLSRTAPGLQLKGFRIRQETPYSNGRFTYMDLKAERGYNLEGSEDCHLLMQVEVKLVTKAPSEKEATPTPLPVVESPGGTPLEPIPPQDDSFDGLSSPVHVAWVLIEASTGIYSFKTRNIDLMGNVQVYGYSLEGELTEWFTTERLFYDWKSGSVRSISPVTYQGYSLPVGQAYKGFVEADISLTEINITDSEPLPDDYKTPLHFPELRPVYAPPEALRFLIPKSGM
jgi:hypothetical protein